MVMEQTPSPQCVGREFVRQYYTLLHEAPDHLHRFYSHNSSFVHGGVEKPGEEQPPVMGQQDIHKKIVSLNFRDCHAKIRQVDSQSTVGSAVVVQVTGELSNNGEPMRRFMQTFVLAPQSPKKYYVHNDIFRYQDEVFHDSETEMESAEESGVFINTGGQPMVESEPETFDEPAAEIVAEQNNFYEQPAQPPLSNGTAHIDEVEAAGGQQMAMESTEPEEVVAVPEIQYDEKEPEKSPQPEAPQEPSEPAKPFSWAALASKNTAPGGAAPPVSTAVVKPQPVAVNAKPEVKQETSPSQPQPQRAPRAQRNDRPRTERENSRSGMDNDEVRRSRYPDTQQLFVGNLPHTCAEKELKTYFETYGKVAEVRINRKSTTRDVPNFGFVVFEEAETVQQILEARPLMLRGEHRLNVEEKKQRGEQGMRPGSGTRIGGRGGMGGGMPRGGMGPRGGGRGGPPRMEGRGGGGRGGFGAPRR